MVTTLLMISLFLFCNFTAAEESKHSDASRLVKFLIRSSNVSVIPVLNHGPKIHPLMVKIGVTLYQIINVDNKNQIITLALFMRQKWQNELLHWHPKDYGGLKEINVQKNMLWVPDLYIYNHAEGGVKSALDQWKTPITINSSGYCKWLAPGVIKTSCKLNIRYFPFDEQRCKIKFGSWTYNGYQLNVSADHKNKQGDTTKFVKSGEWDLTQFPVKRNEEKYACCPEPFPDVTFTLLIKRRTRYYYINMILPNMFITALTLVAFFLPPDCGERISLIITNFLAMVVFLLLVAEILPPNSEVTPMISIYCAGLMCEVGLALVASCVVLRLYCRHSSFDKMPWWVRVIVLKWLATITFNTTLVAKVDEDAEEKAKKFLKLYRPKDQTKPLEDRNLNESTCLLSAPEWDSTFDLDATESTQIEEHCESIASQGEPWSTHKSRKTESIQDASTASEIEPEQAAIAQDAANIQSSSVQDTKDCICKSLVEKLETHQKTLLKHVSNMTNMLTDQEISLEKRKEWQLVSSILDRTFLVFFVVGLIVSSVAIFMQIP